MYLADSRVSTPAGAKLPGLTPRRGCPENPFLAQMGVRPSLIYVLPIRHRLTILSPNEARCLSLTRREPRLSLTRTGEKNRYRLGSLCLPLMLSTTQQEGRNPTSRLSGYPKTKTLRRVSSPKGAKMGSEVSGSRFAPNEPPDFV